MFGAIADVPQGYWVIHFVDQLDSATVEGYHYFDSLGQPYSVVRTDQQYWSVAASHECLEMLADPGGQLTQSGPPLEGTGGDVRYLVEVCDPCQNVAYAYTLDGYGVSDFFGPNFFDAAPRPGQRYSMNGSIGSPRQILPGGYLCWCDASGAWSKTFNTGQGLVTTPVAGVGSFEMADEPTAGARQLRHPARTGSHRGTVRESIDQHSRSSGHTDLILGGIKGKFRSVIKRKHTAFEKALRHSTAQRELSSKQRAEFIHAFHAK